MDGKKVTFDDVIRFCSAMIDGLTNLLGNTTDELMRAKIEAKIGTYYTILEYIYAD